MVAAALVTGDNPYRDLDDLSAKYAGAGYIPPTLAPDAPQPKRAPRTPGALLLAVPLLLVPLDDLVRVANTVSAILIVPTLGLAIWPRRSPLFLALSVPVLVSAPALWNFLAGAVSALVAFLVIAAVVAIKRDSPFLAGASIAMAASLKLFPGILLVVAARRNKRTVLWCGSLLALLNIAPLALGNLAWTEAVSAVSEAGARYASFAVNISITHVIADAAGSTSAFVFFVLALITACVLVYRRPSRVSVDSLLLMSLAILLTPIPWVHYLLGVFPLALLVAVDGETSSATRAATLVGFAVTISVFGISSAGIWVWQSAAGLAVFAFAAGFERLRSLTPVVDPPREPLAAPVSVR